MKLLHNQSMDEARLATLDSICENCVGLCCTAFYFAKTDGFPYNKSEKTRCSHLTAHHQCDIHTQLQQVGLHGCIAYDCLGAGPASVHLFSKDELEIREIRLQLYDVFVQMVQLQQMSSYLIEAMMVCQDKRLSRQLSQAYEHIQTITQDRTSFLDPLMLQSCYALVNPLLKVVWNQVQMKYGDGNQQHNIGANKSFIHQSIRGKDLSMTCLIKLDVSGSTLDGCCLLGADTRDMKVTGADLRNTLYVTQMQINQMIGDMHTLLPIHVKRPKHWR